MISDLLYYWLGNPKLARGVPGVEENTPIYQRDPYYKLLIIAPFWISFFFWSIAALCFIASVVALSGVLGSMNQAVLWIIAGTCLVVGAPFFSVSYVVYMYYWLTIPLPDVAQRQSLTKKQRHLVNGMVFIPWLNMKAWILPGTRRLKDTASAPGSTTLPSVEIWVPQENGGKDRQFIQLQINYCLDVMNLPMTVQRAFDDDFMDHRLENMPGATWLQKITHAKNGVMDKIDLIVLQRLAGIADAALASETIENMINHREDVNDRLEVIVKQKMQEEFGITVFSASIVDVKDVTPATGWISTRVRSSQAEQKSLADQTTSKAERDAEVVAAEAFETGETAKLNAEKAVAAVRVDTAKQQAKAELEVQKILLQGLVARLQILSKDKTNSVALNSVLLKLDQMQPADITALASAVTQAFGHAPQTLVTVGGDDLLKAQPITAFVAALKALFPQLFPNP